MCSAAARRIVGCLAATPMQRYISKQHAATTAVALEEAADDDDVAIGGQLEVGGASGSDLSVGQESKAQRLARLRARHADEAAKNQELTDEAAGRPVK